MELSEALRTRRSVRRFRPGPVPEQAIASLIDAARWAPSGLNNQPWRFYIVRSRATLEALAGFTRYGHILRSASAAVAVFLDAEASYHREKDCQAVGAAIQNLLLAAHGSGLGACWLGEILNRRAEVEDHLATPPGLELMAVVALGYPASEDQGQPERLPVDDLVAGRC